MTQEAMTKIPFRDIPQDILDKIPHPESLARLSHKAQAVHYESCGTKAVEGLLQARLGILVSELDILAEKPKIISPNVKIITPPEHMSRLIHHFTNLYGRPKQKVFATNNGTSTQLTYLTLASLVPLIVHRNHLEGEGKGHFQLVYGVNDGFVYLNNGAHGHVGVWRTRLDNFVDNLWEVQSSGRREKWFLSCFQNSLKLPEVFKGKYM